jgi:hypothetical protein
MVTVQMRRLLGEAAVLVAVVAGSFGLSTTAATACVGSAHCNDGLPPMAAATLVSCTNPKCISGTPPVQATLSECSEPKCLSGTDPTAALYLGCPDPDCIRGVPPVAARLAAAID